MLKKTCVYIYVFLRNKRNYYILSWLISLFYYKVCVWTWGFNWQQDSDDDCLSPRPHCEEIEEVVGLHVDSNENQGDEVRPLNLTAGDTLVLEFQPIQPKGNFTFNACQLTINISNYPSCYKWFLMKSFNCQLCLNYQHFY